VGVIRDYLSRGWDVSELDVRGIGVVLQKLGYEVDPASGHLKKKSQPSTGEATV
jgi:hypothetical protein